MPNPLLLYSTNTLLAYHISQTYYGELHYVWCSALFGAANIPSPYYPNPPSSSPQGIYETLLKAVESGDRHSEKIRLDKPDCDVELALSMTRATLVTLKG